MPQGQQKYWYVCNAFMQGAKVLLFAQLHICYNRKVIAQLFFDP